jgi:predicted ester cyclase
MSVASNKELVQHWFVEIVNGHTAPETFQQALDATFAPHFIDYDGPNPSMGRETLRHTIPLLLQALPDAYFTVEHLISEGDLVAVRLRGQATHTGSVLGNAPTGKRITWTENEIYRLAGGQIVESWGEGGLEEALAEIGLSFRGASHTR